MVPHSPPETKERDMALWRLTPNADATDGRWLDHRRWAEVVVRADTAGEARNLAAALEAEDAPPGVGNETPTFEAGLSDDKLYRLQRINPDDDADAPAADGPSEVVKATPVRA
jgi:hypothetical protein